jgi:hypothetical protein
MEYCDDDREYIRPKRVCTGNGSCLTQTTDYNTYGKDPRFTCIHDCQPVKCPNFTVCGYIAQQWYLDCHGGWCWKCKSQFGKNLTFPEEDQECPICFDTKPCVVQPNCTHVACIECFKRMRIEGPPRTGEPQFPYPDQEDAYYETGPFDPPHPLETDPRVQGYHIAHERWEEEHSLRWQGEENLRKCPLCRS